MERFLRLEGNAVIKSADPATVMQYLESQLGTNINVTWSWGDTEGTIDFSAEGVSEADWIDCVQRAMRGASRRYAVAADWDCDGNVQLLRYGLRRQQVEAKLIKYLANNSTSHADSI